MTTLTASAPAPAKVKRTWHYIQSPVSFEVAPCPCGNHDTQWSEFEREVWCAVCEKDFAPEHNGVFNGPIPMQLCAMLGIRFDRFNMLTQRVERFNTETLTFDSDPAPEENVTLPT